MGSFVLVVIAYMARRLGNNFSETKVMQRERKARAAKLAARIGNSSAAPELQKLLLQTTEKQVSTRLRSPCGTGTRLSCHCFMPSFAVFCSVVKLIVFRQVRDELLGSRVAESLKNPAKMQAMAKYVAAAMVLENLGEAEAKGMAMLAPTDARIGAKEKVDSWASISWLDKLRLIMAEPAAKETISKRLEQRYLTAEALLMKDKTLDGEIEAQVHEDAVQKEISNRDHLRRVLWSSDAIGDGGGYGSCSPVLLMKVFLSALQVLQLARRFDIEWYVCCLSLSCSFSDSLSV